MTGIDTNVLVRYLTHDNDEQYRHAEELLEGECTEEAPGIITTVVLCELCWVLRSSYGATSSELAETLKQLLATRQLRFLHRAAVVDALDLFQKSKADFPDCLISTLHGRSGVDQTYTFDKRAAEFDSWHLLGDR